MIPSVQYDEVVSGRLDIVGTRVLGSDVGGASQCNHSRAVPGMTVDETPPPADERQAPNRGPDISVFISVALDALELAGETVQPQCQRCRRRRPLP